MTWLLITLLIAAIFSWVLTLKYQHEKAELQLKMDSKLSDLQMEHYIALKEYDDEIKRLGAENDRLRRILK